ncbi:hypothetical protein [Flavihumibacter profundi]|uniref:hypothetical protein n=1 Tax=Flavihumibacter profundi TaxID=2716883 RepID=UPI001CC77930|nr:hypothetical protein [Flavihumibacter profundi]MBZ5858512.1 hypothetical protein [Flavihumibacter profundi]
MNKSIRNALFCLPIILFITAFNACSKGGNKPAATKTELLTQKAWKIDKSGIDADKNGTIDIADTWKSCNLDNTFLFIVGGAGNFDEGATKCTDTDPQTGYFDWAFKNQESMLTGNISQLGFSGDANISVLDTATLELNRDITVQGYPSQVRYIFRFKH